MASRTFCIFLIFLFFLPSVLSIGISPPSYELTYEPGLERTYQHRITNTRDVPINVKINVTGPIAQYFDFDDIDTVIPAGGSEYIQYTIKLPEDPSELEPGLNKAKIVVLDNTARGGGSFELKVGVRGVFKLFVPYPDYYATGSISVPNINEGEDIYYKVDLSSKSTKDITGSTLSINFTDLNGVVIKGVTVKDISLPSMQSYSVDDFIKGSVFGRGEYIANASYQYGDGKVLLLSQNFYVGNFEIDIIDHPGSVYAGQITPFPITLQSKWNGDIPKVYATVTIDGKTYTSLERSLEPFGTATFTAYIDDTSFVEGTQKNAEITVYYGGEKTVKNVLLDVVEKEIPVDLAAPVEPMSESAALMILLGSPTTYLVLAVIALIIINVILLRRTRPAKK